MMRIVVIGVFASWAMGISHIGAQEPVMFRGNAAHTGVYATEPLVAYGGIAWRAQTEGPVRSTPAVFGNRVVVGSADGRVYAFDRRDGRQLWTFNAAGAVNGSPAVIDGTVYITDQTSTLYALEGSTGRLLWRIETGPTLPLSWGYESGDLYASSPTIVNQTVYFGAGDGYLYAVDRTLGRISWRLKTGGRIRSTPAVHDSRVFVGSGDGIVYAAAAGSGELIWKHETEGAGLHSGDFGYDRQTVQSSPAISNGRVFIGARDGHLYALDSETGARLWRSSDRISWVNSSPAVAGGLVYAGTSDQQFIQAVDAETGTEVWRQPTRGIVWTSPALVGHRLYVAEGAGRVRALDARTGNALWSAWVGGRLFSSPVIHNGVLFLGTENGGVYALRGGTRGLRRAVFWDSSFSRAAWYQDAEGLADWFGSRGYEVLTAPALDTFLRDRISDGEPSAVVFAIDHVPSDLAQGGDRSVFRRYLNAGGTVVWPGSLPLVWPRDPRTGQPPDGVPGIDRESAQAALDIDFSAGNFDPLGVRSTPAGERIGLPTNWRRRWTIDASPLLEVFAYDENHRAAAWRRNYSGILGTGLVVLWGRSRIPDPTPFLVAAEHRPLVGPDGSGAPDPSGPVGAGDIPPSALRSIAARLATPRYTGFIIGIVDADGPRFHAFGTVKPHGSASPGKTSIYAIASVTKPVTAALLSEMVARGEVALDQPISSLLPDGVTAPQMNGRPITLAHLATHTSGLPRLPHNFDPVDPANPYADYTLGDLYTFLNTYRPERPPGASYEYSNLGYSLLGFILARRAGKSFDVLVRSRIAGPLGMIDTAIELRSDQRSRLLPGYRNGIEVPTWDHPVLQGGGALHSTARDLLRFVAAQVGLRESPLSQVLRRTQLPVDVGGALGSHPTLGWERTRSNAASALWHDGSAGGFKAFIGFLEGAQRGVVVLTNSTGSIVDLGRHLLDPSFELRTLDELLRRR